MSGACVTAPRAARTRLPALLVLAAAAVLCVPRVQNHFLVMRAGRPAADAGEPSTGYLGWRAQHRQLHDLFLYPLAHTAPRSLLLWLRFGEGLGLWPADAELVRSLPGVAGPVDAQPLPRFLLETLFLPNLRLLELLDRAEVIQGVQSADWATRYLFQLNSAAFVVSLAGTVFKYFGLIRALREGSMSFQKVMLAIDLPCEAVGCLVGPLICYGVLGSAFPPRLLDFLFGATALVLQPLATLFFAAVITVMFGAVTGRMALEDLDAAEDDGALSAIKRTAKRKASRSLTFVEQAEFKVVLPSDNARTLLVALHGPSRSDKRRGTWPRSSMLK